MMRILVVDDDKELCDLLKEFLGEEGFSLQCCHTGDEGLEKALQEDFKLIILDVMLPGLNGFDFLRSLRPKSAVPVIMLTARGEEVDKVVGLELGADDYLAKPFSPRELLARIRAVSRRTTQGRNLNNSGDSLKVGDLEIHMAGRTLYRGKERIHLTEIEFQILEILLRSAGLTVNRQDLAQQALGHRLSFDDRSLDVHISNIRRKIGSKMGETERIRTIRGVGYLYAALDE